MRAEVQQRSIAVQEERRLRKSSGEDARVRDGELSGLRGEATKYVNKGYVYMAISLFYCCHISYLVVH